MKVNLATMAVSALALAATGAAGAATLTTGTGDGSLTIDVDDFGSFGSRFDTTIGTNAGAFFDPLGSLATTSTTYESTLFVPTATGRASLSDEAGSAQVLGQSGTELVTSFQWNALDVILTQTVSETFDGTDRIGAALTQTYVFTNADAVAASFDLLRYLDSEIDVDGDNLDAGGLLGAGADRVLFAIEGDELGRVASITFQGVAAGVTGDNDATAAQQFEVAEFDFLVNDIEDGFDLQDQVEGDADFDGLVDAPFDISLALQDFVEIAPLASATYTTTTLFGNALPVVPGGTPDAPLQPTTVLADGTASFEISPGDVAPGQTVFLQPEIAGGYLYTVMGAGFASVTAPAMGAKDPSGFVLSFGGQTVSLAAGETFGFSSTVTEFTLGGLDPRAARDQAAGVSFIDFSGGPVTVGQLASLRQPNIVPLPASVFLMLGALLGLAGLGRVRRAATPAAA